MKKKDVRDFASAVEPKEEDTDFQESDMNKSSANITPGWLLRAAGLSSLVGAGAAGMYGLSKYLSDKYVIPSQISKTEKQLDEVSNYQEDEELEEALENAIAEEEQTELKPMITNEEDYLKVSSKIKNASLGDLPLVPDNNMEAKSLLYGLATPVAAVVPALLTYHFTKKLIDRYRNNSLDNQVEEAKNEFEQILSNKTSSLRDQVDSLYLNEKAAGVRNTSSGKGGFLGDRPRTGTYNPPAPGTTSTIPTDNVEIGPGKDEMGLLYIAGALLAGGGIASYLALRNKIKSDKEQKKVKALRGLLGKNLAAEALQSGVRIRKDDQGLPIVDI
jgi:hypothetical protein